MRVQISGCYQRIMGEKKAIRMEILRAVGRSPEEGITLNSLVSQWPRMGDALVLDIHNDAERGGVPLFEFLAQE